MASASRGRVRIHHGRRWPHAGVLPHRCEESTQNAKLYSWDSKREYRYTEYSRDLPEGRPPGAHGPRLPVWQSTASVSVMNVDGTERKKVLQRQDGASLMPHGPGLQWVALAWHFSVVVASRRQCVHGEGRRLGERRSPEQGERGLPRLAPDGKSIIYRSGHDDKPRPRPARAELAEIGEGAHHGWDNFPFVSPAGDRIVFTRRMPTSTSRCSDNVDGSDVKQLTTTAERCARHVDRDGRGSSSAVRAGVQGRGGPVRRLAATLRAGVPDGSQWRQRRQLRQQGEDSLGTYVNMPEGPGGSDERSVVGPTVTRRQVLRIGAAPPWPLRCRTLLQLRSLRPLPTAGAGLRTPPATDIRTELKRLFPRCSRSATRVPGQSNFSVSNFASSKGRARCASSGGGPQHAAQFCARPDAGKPGTA